MKRGDVVVAAAQGDYGKPRPYLVVQIDTLAADKVSKVVGQLEDDTMTRVNRAMAVWLGIAS